MAEALCLSRFRGQRPVARLPIWERHGAAAAGLARSEQEGGLSRNADIQFSKSARAL